MRTIFWLGMLLGLLIWLVIVQRRLRAERIRGAMYRQLAARLERRLAAQSGQER
jgi:hypothetical protein